ncbi:MAG: sulfatase [Chloroflexi bacterium]|nr:sulfatase [Chloroflexota bacterium]
MNPVKNVVLIVADTFRRDHLGCYGSAIVHTPHLDRLAARAAVFERYYAAGFPTMPTRADHALGKWSFTFMSWEPLPRGETTLGQLLGEAGIRTAAVVDTPFYVANGFGYDRGFQHFLELQTQPDSQRRRLVPRPRTSEHDYCAPRTFLTAEQALEHLYRDRFFLLVDTWDPHEPWDPPEWYVRPYKPDYDGRIVHPPYNYYQEVGLTDDDLATARACYAAECTMVDRWVGRLLERLESLGIEEQTAVIFATDHGFYFGEHGGLFGKMIRLRTRLQNRSPWARSPLYEECAHIPLIVYVPGLPPRRVAQLTSAVDLMPSILEVLGVPAPEGQRLHGRSFVPALQGDSAGGRDIAVTSMPLTSPGEVVGVVDSVYRNVVQYQPATVSTAEWTLLYAARGEAAELYHLPTDPQQRENVAGHHPGVVEDLHRAYVALLEAAGAAEEYLAPRRDL